MKTQLFAILSAFASIQTFHIIMFLQLKDVEELITYI